MISKLGNINNLDYIFKEFDFDKYINDQLPKEKPENEKLEEIFLNYKNNMFSVIQGMRIPFLLAIKYAYEKMWRRFTINSGKTIDKINEIENEFAEFIVRHWDKYDKKVEVELLRINNYIGAKGNYLKDNILFSIAQLWSCLEVFIKDYVIEIVNRNPKIIKTKILKNDYLKKRIKVPDFNVLTEYDFDIMNKMGNIIFDELDFSNFELNKNIINTLFDEKFDIKGLYDLNQTRHIVVHRNGIVDKKYKRNIDCKQEIGCKLEIKIEKMYLFLDTIKELVAKCCSEIELKKYFESALHNQQLEQP